MALDQPPDAAAGAPPAAIVAPAPRAAEPIHIDAGGYHYVVNGNTLLSESDVRAAIEGAADPKAAIESLNKVYQQRGYFLVAIGGEVNNKLVALTVLQGRISETDMSPELAPYFNGVTDRDDVDRKALIKASAVAELYSARQGMRPKVSFAPGAETGSSKMTVVEEAIPGAKPWNATVNFGNLGSRFSSRYTAAAFGSLRPGNGLEMTANYTQGIPGLTGDSAGSQYQSGGVGGSIVTPWGVYSANYSRVAYKIGESTAPLFPVGNIETVTISGSGLAYADELSRLAWLGSYNHVDNIQEVFDGTFVLTDQRYDYVSAGATYNRAVGLFGLSGSVTFAATVLQGLSPRKGTFLPADPGIPNPYFSIVQATAAWTQALPAEFSVTATLNGQYADATVPQNQQWVIGGFGNLTAWLPAVIVGDSGGLARVNVGTPSWAWNGYGVTGSAFAEAGVVRRHLTPIADPKTRMLADAGLSLNAFSPFGTTATVAYAWPIASRNVDLDAINRQSRANLYFSLSQSF